MAVITFIEDVTLETEPQGTGPHYRRGYAPDVSDTEAQKWVAKGVAVRGLVEVAAPVAAEQEAPSETPLPKTSRRGRKTWHPMDEDASE